MKIAIRSSKQNLYSSTSFVGSAFFWDKQYMALLFEASGSKSILPTNVSYIALTWIPYHFCHIIPFDHTLFFIWVKLLVRLTWPNEGVTCYLFVKFNSAWWNLILETWNCIISKNYIEKYIFLYWYACLSYS